MKNNLKILLKENNKLEENLSSENNDIITNIIVYIKCKGICEVDVEIIRKDIIGMALESQLRNEPFSNIIGEDYKGFADSLIKSCSREPVTKNIINFLFMLTVFITSYFVFDYTSYVFKNKTFAVPVSLDFIPSILVGVLIGVFFFKFIGKTIFNTSKVQFLKLWLLCCIYIGVIVISKMLLGHILVINVNFIIVLIFLAAFITCISIINTLYTNNQLLKKQHLK